MANLILRLIGGPDKLIKMLIEKVIGPLLAKGGKGWMTVTGIVIYLFGYVIAARPDLPIVPLFNTIIESLQPFAGKIEDTGLLAILVGIGRRLVVYIPQSK